VNTGLSPGHKESPRPVANGDWFGRATIKIAKSEGKTIFQNPTGVSGWHHKDPKSFIFNGLPLDGQERATLEGKAAHLLPVGVQLHQGSPIERANQRVPIR